MVTTQIFFRKFGRDPASRREPPITIFNIVPACKSLHKCPNGICSLWAVRDLVTGSPRFHSETVDPASRLKIVNYDFQHRSGMQIPTQMPQWHLFTVGGEGFAPPKANGRDVYSVVCLTTPPTAQFTIILIYWSRPRDLNPEPSLYKSVALPIELGRRRMQLL